VPPKARLDDPRGLRHAARAANLER
jgi:hypothetical protein